MQLNQCLASIKNMIEQSQSIVEEHADKLTTVNTDSRTIMYVQVASQIIPGLKIVRKGALC